MYEHLKRKIKDITRGQVREEDRCEQAIDVSMQCEREMNSVFLISLSVGLSAVGTTFFSQKSQSAYKSCRIDSAKEMRTR